MSLVAVILAGPAEARLTNGNLACHPQERWAGCNPNMLPTKVPGGGVVRVGDTYYLVDENSIRPCINCGRTTIPTSRATLFPNQGSGLVRVGDTYYILDQMGNIPTRSAISSQGNGLTKIGDTYYLSEEDSLFGRSATLPSPINDPAPVFVNDPFAGRYPDRSQVYLREGDYYVYSRSNLPMRYYDDYYLNRPSWL